MPVDLTATQSYVNLRKRSSAVTVVQAATPSRIPERGSVRFFKQIIVAGVTHVYIFHRNQLSPGRSQAVPMFLMFYIV